MYRAAANGIKAEGATLYCPGFACVDCARSIICSGIKECVGVRSVMARTPERWVESIKVAENMLIEAGVKCSYYEGTLGVKMWFDGAWVEV